MNLRPAFDVPPITLIAPTSSPKNETISSNSRLKVSDTVPNISPSTVSRVRISLTSPVLLSMSVYFSHDFTSSIESSASDIFFTSGDFIILYDVLASIVSGNFLITSIVFSPFRKLEFVMTIYQYLLTLLLYHNLSKIFKPYLRIIYYFSVLSGDTQSIRRILDQYI